VPSPLWLDPSRCLAGCVHSPQRNTLAPWHLGTAQLCCVVLLIPQVHARTDKLLSPGSALICTITVGEAIRSGFAGAHSERVRGGEHASAGEGQLMVGRC
jgi:hypothetical protein